MPNVSALDFDGSNDVVTVEHDTALNLASGDWTIECWFKDETGANHIPKNILSKTQYDWQPADQPYAMQTAYGQLIGRYRVAGTWYELAGIIPGGNADTNWHHGAIVYVRSTNNMSVYTDGALAAGPTALGATQAGNTEQFRIGDGGQSSYWNGCVDEIRLWSLARTATEIANYKDTRASGSETGLVACFRLDENTGTATTDATPAARVGTLWGPTWTTVMPSLTDAGGGPPPATTGEAIIRGRMSGEVLNPVPYSPVWPTNKSVSYGISRRIM